MANTERAELVKRDEIIKLLSDEENAKVSTAEAASSLAVGQEYLDLEHLDQGIQRMSTSSRVTMGHVIPRSGVHDATWTKILAKLTN